MEIHSQEKQKLITMHMYYYLEAHFLEYIFYFNVTLMPIRECKINVNEHDHDMSRVETFFATLLLPLLLQFVFDTF